MQTSDENQRLISRHEVLYRIDCKSSVRMVHTLVVESVHPRLRHRLYALDRPNVMRLAIVIPADYFCE